jgi:signal peptidase
MRGFLGDVIAFVSPRIEILSRRRLRRAASGLTVAVTACAAITALGLASLLIVVPRVLGLENLVVATGSMSPAFKAGDIALVDDAVQPADIRPGDVITYNGPGGVVTTHRVVSIEVSEGSPVFLTKGDANNAPDSYLVPADALMARAEARLPYMGWVTDFIMRRNVVMAVVFVPAALIVLNEVFTVATAVWDQRRRQGA